MRLPMRISQSRSPPVVGRVIFFPQQPDFARVFGQQVFARKTHSNGESFRAFADQHDVAGMLHDGFGYQGDILDVADAAH